MQQPTTAAKTAATPKTIKKGTSQYFFAIDSEFAYWIEPRGLVKTSRTTGKETVLSGSFSASNAIAVDDTQVYIGASDGIWSISKNGGTPFLVAEGGDAYQIVSDKDYIYWTNSSSGTVMKVSKDGGKPTLLAKDSPNSYGLVQDSENLYWSGYTNGTIKKVSKKGGEVTTLASGQKGPCGLALNDGILYWATFEGKSIMRLEPGKKPQLIVEDENNIAFVVAHQGHIYWGSYNGSGKTTGIFQAKLDGTAVTQIVSQKDCLFITGDKTDLFWVSFEEYPNNGTIYSLAY